ncbi:putative PEP-binding protein, partial [Neisseria sp. P0014.S008]|uniref:putative PEP-binding protein n=1 Tax=Neisseria sp. P0014.S008 TaxID=3436754 RepID=UPI003F80AB3B
AQRQLTERGETLGPVSIGCMIEFQSAAITVGIILKLVDFVSIGTNDLILYVLSVDRGDDSVSLLYQPGHHAVLNTLQH